MAKLSLEREGTSVVCYGQEQRYLTEILPIDIWPEGEGEIVEFRLIYKGRIPAESHGGGGSRIREKHKIRLAVH